VVEADVPEAFHDLDEIYSRYIEPMNDLVTAIVNHRSFLAGTASEVEAVMIAQRREAPTKCPYFFRYEENKVCIVCILCSILYIVLIPPSLYHKYVFNPPSLYDTYLLNPLSSLVLSRSPGCL
jgi:hypothetical protein